MPGSSASDRPSFAECRAAARAVRKADRGKEAIRVVRGPGVALSRPRPPLALLLYASARRGLLVWQSAGSFAALSSPDDEPAAVRSRAWWFGMLVRWWPAVLLGGPVMAWFGLITVGALVARAVSDRHAGWYSLGVLMGVLAALLYTLVLMVPAALEGLLLVGRVLDGRVSVSRQRAERLMGRSWAIALCHVDAPPAQWPRLRAAVEAVVPAGQQLFAVESGITSAAARQAVHAGPDVRPIPDTAPGLLALRHGRPAASQETERPPSGFAMLVLAYISLLLVSAMLVAGTERDACVDQPAGCAGRPATFGEALYWLVRATGRFTDPESPVPATTPVRILGLFAPLLGLIALGAAVASVVRYVRWRRQVDRSADDHASQLGGGVFINYRWQAAHWPAAGIRDHLLARFHQDQVFLDVRSIQPGGRYPDELRDRLAASRVLLAVIHQEWLADLDRRCADGGLDWVRYEIETALSMGKVVMPVLLDGAQLPKPQELPESLTELAMRQARQVRSQAFREDCELLAEAVAHELSKAPATPSR